MNSEKTSFSHCFWKSKLSERPQMQLTALMRKVVSSVFFVAAALKFRVVLEQSLFLVGIQFRPVAVNGELRTAD